MICTVHQTLFGVMKFRRIRRSGHVTHMGDRRGAYRVLVGRSDGKGLHARPVYMGG